MDDVRGKLLPNLHDEIRTWRSNFDGDGDPEEHFDGLVEALTDYKDHLAEHPDAVAQLESALASICEVVEELRAEQPGEPDSDDYYGRGSSGTANDDSRSIFDDVDH